MVLSLAVMPPRLLADSIRAVTSTIAWRSAPGGRCRAMRRQPLAVKPIVTMAGDHEVNQVFFDNVRVPKANRIGEENQGWTVAKYLLEFERGGGSGAGLTSRRSTGCAFFSSSTSSC